MMKLEVSGWSLDKDLQIVQADVLLELDGEVVIEETLCMDVGLPSLLLSVTENVTPDRFSSTEQWESIPFFVCGCGDPDCRAYSFGVEQLSAGRLRLTEIEESETGWKRKYSSWEIPQAEYGLQIIKVAENFLQFVEGKDYRPALSQTVELVKKHIKLIRQNITKE
jgi:hypothetical protein